MVRQALPTIHILFENPAWIPPLQAALQKQGFQINLLHVNEGSIDPSTVPAEGIWLNRISPSSHTRGHEHTVELTRQLLYWLESHGRRVVNGTPAFELEMSKLRQDVALRRYGIRTPRTVLAVGRDHLLETAKSFTGPFITKHDQGGKGLGIRLFQSFRELEHYLNDQAFDAGPGSRMILQQYVSAPQPFITRVEIVGGRFVLAMRSSTAQGFELCPSDACNPTPVCAADSDARLFSPSPISAHDPLVQRYIEFCRRERIEIAGIEFVEDANGRRYTYDVNGTTNFNQALGTQLGIDGMGEVARYVRRIALRGGQKRRVAC